MCLCVCAVQICLFGGICIQIASEEKVDNVELDIVCGDIAMCVSVFVLCYIDSEKRNLREKPKGKVTFSI